jgi:hypothetical protein
VIHEVAKLYSNEGDVILPFEQFSHDYLRHFSEEGTEEGGHIHLDAFNKTIAVHADALHWCAAEQQ